jgi:hypothetical protein
MFFHLCSIVICSGHLLEDWVGSFDVLSVCLLQSQCAEFQGFAFTSVDPGASMHSCCSKVWSFIREMEEISVGNILAVWLSPQLTPERYFLRILQFPFECVVGPLEDNSVRKWQYSWICGSQWLHISLLRTVGI